MQFGGGVTTHASVIYAYSVILSKKHHGVGLGLITFVVNCFLEIVYHICRLNLEKCPFFS